MQTGAVLRCDFGMGMTRFINSRDTWLALDDHSGDGKMAFGFSPEKTGSVTAEEMELYHRQLFYWLLIRNGPCIFPAQTDLKEGIPAWLHTQN